MTSGSRSLLLPGSLFCPARIPRKRHAPLPASTSSHTTALVTLFGDKPQDVLPGHQDIRLWGKHIFLSRAHFIILDRCEGLTAFFSIYPFLHSPVLFCPTLCQFQHKAVSSRFPPRFISTQSFYRSHSISEESGELGETRPERTRFTVFLHRLFSVPFSFCCPLWQGGPLTPHRASRQLSATFASPST